MACMCTFVAYARAWAFWEKNYTCIDINYAIIVLIEFVERGVMNTPAHHAQFSGQSTWPCTLCFDDNLSSSETGLWQSLTLIVKPRHKLTLTHPASVCQQSAHPHARSDLEDVPCKFGAVTLPVAAVMAVSANSGSYEKFDGSYVVWKLLKKIHSLAVRTA